MCVCVYLRSKREIGRENRGGENRGGGEQKGRGRVSGSGSRRIVLRKGTVSVLSGDSEIAGRESVCERERQRQREMPHAHTTH